MNMEPKLRAVCAAFRIPGEFAGYKHLKVGNVNQTYRVFFDMPDKSIKSYIVQKVNTFAFRAPEQLMHNADLITEHIRARKQGQASLHYHHTKDRKTFVYDEDQGFWRLSNFISSHTYNNCSDEQILWETGAAFGEFQNMLSDFPVDELYETIPNFHDTPKRLHDLFDEVARDPVGRVKEVQEELEYISLVQEEAGRLTQLYREGKLPIRVTHNDTKINNVLFDPETKHAIAIIDLDTVMPGLVGHDFGDGVRFAANVAEEDCPDLTQVSFDLDRFAAFTRGFMSQAGAALTPLERETLPLSAFAITVELASRFLADYLQGDLYFKTDYPTHNLVRTRCQLALAKDIHSKLEQMQEIVNTCAQSGSCSAL